MSKIIILLLVCTVCVINGLNTGSSQSTTAGRTSRGSPFGRGKFLRTQFSQSYYLTSKSSYRKYRHRHFNRLFSGLSADPNGNRFSEDANSSTSDMMPDRIGYSNFFQACLKSSATTNTFITIDSFCDHDDIRVLLAEGLIELDDIKRFWDSKIASVSSRQTVQGKVIVELNEDDSYDVLCEVLSFISDHKNSKIEKIRSLSIPTDTFSSGGDLKYLEREFSLLSLGKPFVSYNSFLQVTIEINSGYYTRSRIGNSETETILLIICSGRKYKRCCPTVIALWTT